MSDSFKYEVDEENIRLDQFLVKKLADVSRSKIQLAIKSGKVLVDGEKLKSSAILKGDERVEGELLIEVENKIHMRKFLPFSLSYDHRVIDGADAARFTTRLGKILSNLEELTSTS